MTVETVGHEDITDLLKDAERSLLSDMGRRAYRVIYSIGGKKYVQPVTVSEELIADPQFGEFMQTYAAHIGERTYKHLKGKK